MKKTSLIAIICAMTATSPLFGQAPMQSLSFSGPSAIDITTTNTFTLSVNLTFGPYNGVNSLSYWLEVQNALAPFLTITGVTHFTLPDAPPPPVPIAFSGGPSYSGEAFDLGGGGGSPLSAGTYHVTDLTFTLAPGTLPGMYDLRSTAVNPHASEVSSFDGTTFDDHFLPVANFTINIVPEPSTLALLGFAAAGLVLVVYRCRRPAH